MESLGWINDYFCILVILVYMYSFFVKISAQPRTLLWPSTWSGISSKNKTGARWYDICLFNPLLCLQDVMVWPHY